MANESMMDPLTEMNDERKGFVKSLMIDVLYPWWIDGSYIEIWKPDLIKNASVTSNFDEAKFTNSKQTLSFKNQAYAFWLDGETSRFSNDDFDGFLGDFLYEPVTIEAFGDARAKRRAVLQLYVTETVDDLFIIETLWRKRKRKPKYPKFYNGESISYLFEKTDTGIRLVTTLKVQNN